MEIVKAIIHIIKTKKRALWFLFFFLSSVFILHYSISDRIYISSIKLAHNSQDGSYNSSGLSRIVSSFSSSNLNSVSSSTTNFDMIPEVLSSRDFLNKILDKEFFYNGKMEKLYMIYSNKNSDDPNIPLLKLDGRKELLKNISVSKNLNNPIIGISISSNNRQLSMDIATSILGQLELELTNFQLERLDKKIGVIQNQVESTSGELALLEEELRKFRVNNSNILQSPTLRMQESNKLRDILVLSNTYSSLKVELELAKIKYFEEANVLQVIDSPNLPLKKSGPRLRYMLMRLVFTFSFFTLFYVYVTLLLKSDFGKEIKNTISVNRELD
tara:strand:- start:11650 stop:12636 length:987 start_codon:yes stop_codon:yes gene_type:complete